MIEILPAVLLGAIGASIGWVWAFRRLIAAARRQIERRDSIIAEMHADLMNERRLRELRCQAIRFGARWR